MRIIYFFFLATLLWSFWGAMARIRRRGPILTPTLGWMVGLGFFILAPLTIMVFNGGYEIPSFYDVNDNYAKVDLSNVIYFIPVLVIWMSLLLSFVAVLLFAPDPNHTSERRDIVFNESNLKKAVLITGGLALLNYAATIWAMGGLQAFLVSQWYQQRWLLVAQLGDPYVLYMWLLRVNQIVFTVTAVLYTHSQVRTQKVNWRFSILILFLFILYTVINGERMFLALYTLSFAASCWIYRRRKLVAILLMIAPALAIVFSAWAYFRNDLSSIAENVPRYSQGDLGNPAVTTLMYAFEGNDTMILFHIINDFGHKYEYLYGASYARIIFFWIPRDLYPQKPAGFEIQLATLYEPGEVTSLNGTALGEMYANFGGLSVLTLPLFTLCTLYLDRRLTLKRTNKAVLSATVFVLLIWIARSAFVDDIVILLFAGILISALNLEKSFQGAINWETA